MEILETLRNLSSKKGKENLTIKLISLIIILVIGVIFGLIPYFITSCRKKMSCLSLVNTFSGGLFLGIGLFHILPEANEKFEKYKKLEDVPLAYFLSFISYALVLFVEKIAFDGHSLLHGHEDHHEHNHEEHPEIEEKIVKKKIVIKKEHTETESNLIEKKKSLNDKNSNDKSSTDKNSDDKKSDENQGENLQLRENKIQNENSKEENINKIQKENIELKEDKNIIESKQTKNKYSFNEILKLIFSSESEIEGQNKTFENNTSNILIYNQNKNIFISKKKLNKLKRTNSLPTLSLSEINEKKNLNNIFQNIFTPLVLLFALGFHGIFEGLALGIEEKKKDVLFLLLAISAHKWAASLSLGISFIKAKTTKKIYIIMTMIFAVIGPFGIVLGLILSQNSNDLVEGILLGISVGTFLYVACSEVLVEEFANKNNKYFKFILFILGGAFCAGLSFIEMLENEDE